MPVRCLSALLAEHGIATDGDEATPASKVKHAMTDNGDKSIPALEVASDEVDVASDDSVPSELQSSTATLGCWAGTGQKPGDWLQGPLRMPLLEYVAKEFDEPLSGTEDDLEASSLFWQGVHNKGLSFRSSIVPSNLRGGLASFQSLCRGVMTGQKNNKSPVNKVMMNILNELIAASKSLGQEDAVESAANAASTSAGQQEAGESVDLVSANSDKQQTVASPENATKSVFKRRREPSITPQKEEKTSKRIRSDTCWAQSAASSLDAWQSSMRIDGSGTDIVLGDMREPALKMAKAYLNALEAGYLGRELSAALQAAALDLVQLAAAVEAVSFTPAANVSSRYTARLTDGRVWALQKVWYDALVACSYVVGADKEISKYFRNGKHVGLQLGMASSDFGEKLLTLESGGCSVAGMGFLSRASVSVCQVAAIVVAACDVPASGLHNGPGADLATVEESAGDAAVVDDVAPVMCTDVASVDITVVDDNVDRDDDSDEDTPIANLGEDVSPLTSLT